jgi:hypothetical protein
VKIKIKAFLFACNIIRKTIFKSFMIHYNAYKNAHTNVNAFNLKNVGGGEVYEIKPPTKDG